MGGVRLARHTSESACSLELTSHSISLYNYGHKMPAYLEMKQLHSSYEARCNIISFYRVGWILSVTYVHVLPCQMKDFPFKVIMKIPFTIGAYNIVTTTWKSAIPCEYHAENITMLICLATDAARITRRTVLTVTIV